MNNKKGFISSTVIYTFFIVTILLMSASLMTYATKRKLTTNLKTTAEQHECDYGPNSWYVDGMAVTYEEYSKSCPTSDATNPECKEINNVFYGPNGNVVGKDEYNKKCKYDGKSVCEKDENGTFVDSNGIEHSSDYDKYCNCAKEISSSGYVYYRKGTIVDKDPYYDSCPDQTIDECYTDGTKYYYNEKQVDEEYYNTTCNNSKICKNFEGKNYDINGAEVSDPSDVISSCKCQTSNNNGKTLYYGSMGSEVTEDEYNKQCQTICSSGETLMNCAILINYSLNNSQTYSNIYSSSVVKKSITTINKSKLSTPSQEINKIYYTTDTGTGDNRTYYYRGKTNNNWVKFAGKMWRIVSMSANKGVKLILDDENTTFQSQYLSTDKTKRYNVGLMHSNSEESWTGCYNDKYANVNNSTILDNLYNFYTSNGLNNYSSYSYINTSAVFIADKNIIGGNSDNNAKDFCYFLYNKDNLFVNVAESICNNSNLLSIANNSIDYFSGLNRVMSTSNVTIDTVKTGTNQSWWTINSGTSGSIFCDNAKTKLSEYSAVYNSIASSQGRAKLKYSIGLLTVDEAIYAGLDLYYSQGDFKEKRLLIDNLDESYLTSENYTTESYLDNEQDFWLATPAFIDKNITKSKNVYSTILLNNAEVNNRKGLYYFAVDSKGGIKVADSNETLNVRPVIVLNGNVKICSNKQDGTKNNPFTVCSN